MPTDDHSASRLERARAHRDGVGRVLDAPFADLLVSRALLAAGHDALDLACGVGILAPRVAAVVGDRGSVTALEEDPACLELARADSSAAAASADVAWRRGRLDRLPFEEASFDAVLSCHGLERLGDPAACLDEARRVLRLGGRISLAVWGAPDRNPLFGAVAGVLVERLSGEAALRRVESYRAGFEGGRPELWIERLERAGFVMVSAEEQRLDLELPAADGFLPLYLHAVGLGEAFRELDPHDRTTIQTELAAAIDSAADDKGRLPFRSVLAFGRAWRS